MNVITITREYGAGGGEVARKLRRAWAGNCSIANCCTGSRD